MCLYFVGLIFNKCSLMLCVMLKYPVCMLWRPSVRMKQQLFWIFIMWSVIQFLLVQFFIVRARMYYLHVYYMCWYASGRSSSCDLSLGFERQLFAVDIFWQLLCSSAKLHESLLQVAVWVSVIVTFAWSLLSYICGCCCFFCEEILVEEELLNSDC